MSFFLGSWGMNRSAEQTNRPRTASRFTRFVCPALRFIPHEPRKKDTHSLSVFIPTDNYCIYAGLFLGNYILVCQIILFDCM